MAPFCLNSEQSRYSIVRKKLDKLGFDSPLTIDSLQLVEKLLEDLVTTTDSLRRYKNLYKNTIEKCKLYEQGVEPYMKENSKLVKSCNELHKKVLSLQDNLEDERRTHQRKLDNLQAEVDRFKIMERQYGKCIKELENECAEKTIKLHRGVQPRARPAFRPAGSSKGEFPPLRSKSAKDSARSSKHTESQSEFERMYFEPPNNILNTVETQASNLSHELQKIRGKLEELKLENGSVKDKLKRRDQEIERLQNMLEGGMPIKRVVQDSCPESDKFLEVKLKESEDQKHEAMKNAVRLVQKCDRLTTEMKDIDKLACELRDEKIALEERLAQCEENYMRCCNENHDLKAQMMQSNLTKGCKCSGQDQNARDKSLLQEKLDSVSKELNEMKSREKTLLVEIKKLSDQLQAGAKHSSAISRKASSRSGSRHRDVNDSRETAAKTLANNLPTADSIQREAEIERLVAEKEKLEKRCKLLADEMSAMSDNGVLNLVQQISLKDKELIAIQQENSNLMRENSSLQTQLKFAKESNPSTDLRSLLTQIEKDKAAAKAELHSALAERDALKDQLKFVSGKLSERQSAAYSTDTDRVNQLESERRELLQQKGSNQTHITNLEQQVRSLESELTKQRTQYLQLKNLHEQTEANLAVCQGELSQMRRDTAMSQGRLSELKTLQAEVVALREERSRMWTELNRNSGDKDAFKLQLDEKSERIALLQKEINAKESWIAKLEKNLTELKEVLQGKGAPNKNIRVTTKVKTSVKSRSCTTPPSSRSSKSKPFPPKRWIRNAAVVHSPPSRVTQDSDLAHKQDARGLQREVERLRKELEQAAKVKQASEIEIKRLQDDLSASLKDCKISKRDLDIAQRDVEDLKQRLQNYVSEVQRIENLLSNKEEERNALLEQFHSLSQEAIELETHNTSLKSEAHQVKHSLEVTTGQVSHLEDQLSASKELIFGYESQVVNLTRLVKNLEVELRTVKEQSESFEKDLNAVHELCMKLDSQKESLEDDLKLSNKRSLELEANCAKLKSELETLNLQLQRELASKGAIESVLEENREESMKQRLTNVEMAQELDKIRSEVTKMRQTQDRDDVSRYTRVAAEKSQEVDALRRELTKEKFEKARLQEESHSSRQIHQRSTSPPSSVHSLKSLSPAETSD
ncbi:centrosomal protein of 135 kDa isoform X1 [Neocloeon triangulifer]|uniref:centrosomal protein of 135 kDa isoform X1 n=1 Tax=Neocloeon triangulifer TaxID=2078957 RepID=UPI00286F2E71|nr:centrosomal protein of 135 kDa isoform X1 [Neocloeon triangulifer]